MAVRRVPCSSCGFESVLDSKLESPSCERCGRSFEPRRWLNAPIEQSRLDRWFGPYSNFRHVLNIAIGLLNIVVSLAVIVVFLVGESEAENHSPIHQVCSATMCLKPAVDQRRYETLSNTGSHGSHVDYYCLYHMKNMPESDPNFYALPKAMFFVVSLVGLMAFKGEESFPRDPDGVPQWLPFLCLVINSTILFFFVKFWLETI